MFYPRPRSWALPPLRWHRARWIRSPPSISKSSFSSFTRALSRPRRRCHRLPPSRRPHRLRPRRSANRTRLPHQRQPPSSQFRSSVLPRNLRSSRKRNEPSSSRRHRPNPLLNRQRSDPRRLLRSLQRHPRLKLPNRKRYSLPWPPRPSCLPFRLLPPPRRLLPRHRPRRRQFPLAPGLATRSVSFNCHQSRGLAPLRNQPFPSSLRKGRNSGVRSLAVAAAGQTNGKDFGVRLFRDPIPDRPPGRRKGPVNPSLKASPRFPRMRRSSPSSRQLWCASWPTNSNRSPSRSSRT